MEHITRAQVDSIHHDGCRVVDVTQSKDGKTVILYTDNGLHLFARIVHESGTATRRYINDLAMYVQQKRDENAYKIQYIRILGDKINQGFGTLMMNQLLRTARDNKIDYIDGRMQDAGTEEHEARLRHFYHKFGFLIDEDRQLLWRRGDEQ
ncbi:GNAT superfamily N-acetyltransferase [Paenibacillus phyllosphaerae]|uniref:GNAT superfamily N-acetyltransferase n=1 Tax=Paenibacillus phyllosphaerae TaxID=274593 RepID=A0A7W5B3H0_9BACL|nr:GNAT family N-acetyltransferase [Paenibacillus phyllosphaerae]MBB3113552.1 GNAT superfamily N-acetyltransferase [Paenibacillus phyllosphaerae]